MKESLEEMFSGDMSSNDFPYCGEEPRDGYGVIKNDKPAAKSLKSASRKKKKR